MYVQLFTYEDHVLKTAEKQEIYVTNPKILYFWIF